MSIAAKYFAPDIVSRAHAALNEVVAGITRAASGHVQGDGSFNDIRMISDPILADHIFRQSDIFHKDFLLINRLTESRISQNSARWKIMRDYTQPKFNEFMRGNSKNLVHDVVSTELDKKRLHNGEDFLASANNITLGVFLGLLKSTIDVDDMRHLLDESRILITMLQAEGWSTDYNIAGDTLTDMNDEILARFLRFCESDKPTLQLISDNPIREHDLGIRASLTDFFHNIFAGYETSSAALTWMAVIIGSNPKLQDRLHEAAMNDEDDMLFAFISETLRMFPPFPIVARRAVEDITIEGHEFRKNEYILISLMGVNRHQDYWDSPQKFRPFREEFLNGSYDKRAYVPFISGARVCGGRRIAELELQIVLKEMLKRMRFSTDQKAFTHDYALSQRAVMPKDFTITPLSA